MQDRDRDNFIPGAEELWPYVEPHYLTEMKRLFHLAEVPSSVVSDAMGGDEKAANDIALRSIAMLNGQRVHALLLKSLRSRILSALDEGRADTGADIYTNLAKSAPRNEKIASLFMKLAREKGSGRSDRSIAIEFTDGDGKLADSLLRGVRRYRGRL